MFPLLGTLPVAPSAQYITFGALTGRKEGSSQRGPLSTSRSVVQRGFPSAGRSLVRPGARPHGILLRQTVLPSSDLLATRPARFEPAGVSSRPCPQPSLVTPISTWSR